MLRGALPLPPRAAHEVEALRAQLREVEQDAGRGVLSESEAAAARIELSRRLIAAADRAEQRPQSVTGSARSTPLALALGIAVPLVAGTLYLGLGSPSMPDVPLAERRALDRPSQAQAEANAARTGTVPRPDPIPATDGMPSMDELVARLEERLEESPDDRRGLTLLASSYMQVGRFAEAARTYRRIIDLTPDPVDPALFVAEADAMIDATGGYVSPEAEAAIDAALRRDPQAPQARHFKALALAQRGETAAALDLWVALLASAPPEAPWLPLVRAHAHSAAQEEGVALPASLLPPGPTEAEREAAQTLSPAARADMIDAMVAGLAARLEEDPGDLEGWLRLIRAYRVLGRDDDLRAAGEKALATFANDAAATGRIEEALP